MGSLWGGIGKAVKHNWMFIHMHKPKGVYLHVFAFKSDISPKIYNHLPPVAPVALIFVSQFTTLVITETSTIGFMAMKFRIDNHGPQRLNPDFGYRQIFPVVRR